MNDSWIVWLFFGWMVVGSVECFLDWLIGQVLDSVAGGSSAVAGEQTFYNFSDHSGPNFTTSYHPCDQLIIYITAAHFFCYRKVFSHLGAAKVILLNHKMGLGLVANYAK